MQGARPAVTLSCRVVKLRLSGKPTTRQCRPGSERRVLRPFHASATETGGPMMLIHLNRDAMAPNRSSTQSTEPGRQLCSGLGRGDRRRPAATRSPVAAAKVDGARGLRRQTEAPEDARGIKELIPHLLVGHSAVTDFHSGLDPVATARRALRPIPRRSECPARRGPSRYECRSRPSTPRQPKPCQPRP